MHQHEAAGAIGVLGHARREAGLAEECALLVARHAKVLLTSKIAADDVLEAYKSQEGTKVFLYERKPLASAIKPSRLEQAAQDCK